jgi:thioredoxin reductase (NADPH)
MKSFGLDDIQDLVIIGVGPPALVALLEAKRAGLSAVGIDKGPVCSALVKHPTYMKWFSTSDRLELAGFPLLTEDKSPTKREYLKYCRAFLKHHDLKVNTYRTVTAIRREHDVFVIDAHDPFGRPYTWRARNVAVGTGFYDNPRPLHVPGEHLPHVTHTYTEAHLYSFHHVVVIGGGSSAAEAALELWREGAHVTVVMRDERFHTKFWVEPDIENRIKEGSIVCHRYSRVIDIAPDHVTVITREGEVERVPADFVLAMTGYEPDTSLLKAAGAHVDENSNKPLLNDHLESTVPGLYVMGTLIAGVESNVVFIENSRDHGARIVGHILTRRGVSSLVPAK